MAIKSNEMATKYMVPQMVMFGMTWHDKFWPFSKKNAECWLEKVENNGEKYIWFDISTDSGTYNQMQQFDL